MSESTSVPTPAALPATGQQTAIGVAAIALGGLMALGATAIPSDAGYAGVGPNFLPWVVAGVLVLCGAWLIFEARTGGWRAMEAPSGATRGDWPALAWVAAGIATNASLLTTLGPPEYFCLMLLAFTTVSAVLGQSTLRGMTALFIGLAIGLVGLDQITAQVRYTGGIPEFMDGIEVVLVAVGLFAVGECMYTALYEGRVEQQLNRMGSVHMTRAEWRRSWPAWLRGTFIGFPFGTIPAGGAEIPTFLSYGVERKLSKFKGEFGTIGAIEGVAGPEAANNAAVTATLVPLLTLGIPTSVTAAILLSALQNYGINAGPQLFQTSSTLVWALIASLYIGNVMLLVLNLPLVGLWVKLLKIPRSQLYAGILIFATIGVYGMRQSAFDLFLMGGIGLVGVVMRRFDFPTAPVIVGMILGPMAEAQMRNALSIGEGHWGVFIERPMSATLLAAVVVVAVLVLPRVVALAQRRRG